MLFRSMVMTVYILACAPTALAQITEVKLGISEFDEKTLSLGLSSRLPTSLTADQRLDRPENSLAINGDIVFAEPEFLKWALSPQPYIGGTLNLEGETSYAGAGLLWRQTFGDKFYGDFSFGLVVHNGTTNVSDNISFVERLGRLQNEIQLGSRILFREQLAIGYRFTDEWAGEVFIEHLSNGQILASTNEGVDILGARIAKRFY